MATSPEFEAWWKTTNLAERRDAWQGWQAHEALTGWQPIDAAPLDGTRVNLCWKADCGLPAHVELGKYSRAGKVWLNTYGKMFSSNPDYFQTLPNPPVAP